MQTAIEAEVTEFSGRERCAHGERTRQGSRKGSCPTTIKTTAAPVIIERHKLRGNDYEMAAFVEVNQSPGPGSDIPVASLTVKARPDGTVVLVRCTALTPAEERRVRRSIHWS